MEINESAMHEHGCSACGNEICYFKSLALSSILTLKYYFTETTKSILLPSRQTISFFFYLVVLIDTFPSIISQDLYSDMQRIEDWTLDFNLAEITQIRDLPGQFGACAQQCENGLLTKLGRKHRGDW